VIIGLFLALQAGAPLAPAGAPPRVTLEQAIARATRLDPDYVREGLRKWRDARRAAAASRPASGADRAADADEPPLRRASGA